ncbi:MAG: S1C family serine protease [Planctomycetota bacterium]|jgi:tetratricopeptide (TPR) repeat protein
MKTTGRFAVVFLSLFLFASGTTLAGQADPDAGRLHEEAMRLLQSKRFEDAIRKYAVILRKDPHDMIALYNVACACSLLGKIDRAVAFLERAVEEGYRDFEHMEEDPDLDPIRGEAGYKDILANREKYLRQAEAMVEKKYREKLGNRYSFTKDETYKILFITNVGEDQRKSLMNALTRYADAHWRDFFKFKPRHMVTILVPRNMEDYAKEFGGRRGQAGFYNHGNRTLTVNLATGSGTMIHEWTHALHYGDLEGLKQKHPKWIVEGFGSLYEQCRILRGGKAIGLTNWRLPGLQRALGDRPECYIPWKKLMDPKTDVWTRSRQSIASAYAESRYIFYYMQQKNVLREFYRLYRKRFAEDPTGAKFVEEVLGKKIDEVEAEWKPWVMELRYTPLRPRPGPRPKVRLGIIIQTADEGVGVEEVQEGSCAEKAGLRAGDVIVAFDGRKVKGRTDLIGALAAKKPGDKARVTVRRGKEEIEMEVVLDAR